MASSALHAQEVITISPVHGASETYPVRSTGFAATPEHSCDSIDAQEARRDRNKTALLIIDLCASQEDFCPPNGSLAVSGGRDIAPAINELLRLPFDLKVATRDWHPADHISFAHNHGKKPFEGHTIHNPENPQEKQTTVLWPSHCVQQTKGADLIPELNKPALNYILNKGMDSRVESYSAFGPPYRNPSLGSHWLKETLRRLGVRRVFVVGLAFDYCVKCTAIDAADFGFETFVLTDCTNAVDSSTEARTALSGTFHTGGVRLITSEQLSVTSDGSSIAVEYRTENTRPYGDASGDSDP